MSRNAYDIGDNRLVTSRNKNPKLGLSLNKSQSVDYVCVKIVCDSELVVFSKDHFAAILVGGKIESKIEPRSEGQVSTVELNILLTINNGRKNINISSYLCFRIIDRLLHVLIFKDILSRLFSRNS